MFFIFGWGHQTTNDRGPTVPAHCPNCDNDTWLHFLSFRTWFTLFFIPVIPYESKNLLLCPICSAGLELSGAAVEKAQRLNDAARAFQQNQIGEQEFAAIAEESKMLTGS